MDHLIAKTKGRHGDFFNVISGEPVFDMPDLDKTVNYQPGHNLDEETWFKIKKFSKKDFCIDFLRDPFVATEYIQIRKADYKNIEYLCSFQDNVYYFQKLTPKKLLRKKVLWLDNAPSFYKGVNLIVIDSYADAIYIKDHDILYFKSLTTISSIFKGIDILYREATQEETEKFLTQPFIKVEDGFNADLVKTANRKRIAMAMDIFEGFKPKEKRKLSSYIRDYCAELEFDEETSKFSIRNEAELKQLLYGIEQRYYTTPIGAERRLANSVIKL